MGTKPIVNLSGGKGSADRRQGHCKLCRRGIFEGQQREWFRQPLGLVHSTCVRQPEEEFSNA